MIEVDKKGRTDEGHKVYVITSAQASYEEKTDRKGEVYHMQRGDVASPNKNLLKGLESYCSDNGAELIILTMAGKDARETIMHESLADRPELYHGNMKLNSNIQISDMIVPPQNIDPSTGRLRFAQRDTTLVYAHSKQRLRAVPSSNSKLPKLLVTTGAVTMPNYKEFNHKADVARRDHTYGGVVVEIIDKVFYNVRHIEAQKDGKFIDLGKKWNGANRPTNAKTEALVLGDLHVGDTDPKTRAANYEMIDFFKPKRLVLHDLLSGHSINPHEKDNVVTRIQDWNDGRLNLEKELRDANRELKNLARAMGKRDIYVVASNHDFFLDRYLERGEFLKEPWNANLALKLASQMCEGRNPVEEGIKIMGGLPSNVHFLDLNSDLKVWGCQLASHGHRGNSGAKKGNATSRELAHGKSITGHTHSPEKIRNTFIVGTSTKLNLPYTDGSASSWMAANAVLYEGGLVQLIPVINGKWKMKR